jgi:hypothetical protein
MKYFGVYLKDGRIQIVQFLGFIEDGFINGVKVTGLTRAINGARHFFDELEHDNFYVTKLEDLVHMDSQIRQAINDSNFPVR